MARDTGAAKHIAALIDAAESNEVSTCFVAKGEAADCFSENNLRFWSASEWFGISAHRLFQ